MNFCGGNITLFSSFRQDQRTLFHVHLLNYFPNMYSSSRDKAIELLECQTKNSYRALQRLLRAGWNRADPLAGTQISRYFTTTS